MSTLSQFSGGGIKQIKTGFVLSAAPSNVSPGPTSLEDYHYYNVTLTGDPVSDITKCVIVFDGVGHGSGSGANINGSTASSSYFTRVVTARLENTTTLRLCQQYDLNSPAASAGGYRTTGRWTIIEYR